MAISAGSAVATIAAVVAILLATGAFGTPGPAVETISAATPTRDVIVRVAAHDSLPEWTLRRYRWVPILDTHRCLASDHEVTVE